MFYLNVFFRHFFRHFVFAFGLKHQLNLVILEIGQYSTERLQFRVDMSKLALSFQQHPCVAKSNSKTHVNIQTYTHFRYLLGQNYYCSCWGTIFEFILNLVMRAWLFVITSVITKYGVRTLKNHFKQ